MLLPLIITLIWRIHHSLDLRPFVLHFYWFNATCKFKLLNTVQTNKMDFYKLIFYINISITCNSISKTTYTVACKTYHTITAYTTVFQKRNPCVRNMWKTSKIKNWNINLERGAFCWFIVYNYITMHGAKNIKFTSLLN